MCTFDIVRFTDNLTEHIRMCFIYNYLNPFLTILIATSILKGMIWPKHANM